MTKPAGSTGLVVAVETRFIHASGEWIATTLKLPTTETAPQRVGSLTTYLRRYGLLALSACASEDDDGQEAQGPPPRQTRPQARQEPRQEPTSAKPAQARPPLENELPPANPPKPARTAVKVVPPPAEPAPVATSTVRMPEVRPAPRKQPLDGGRGITAADRGLLFKVAKEQQLTERQVKSLIHQLFGYVSTSHIEQGQEFGKVLGSMESPADHGVTFAEDDAIYDREADSNALAPIGDVTEGM